CLSIHHLFSKSTLSPYTTLFRSQHLHHPQHEDRRRDPCRGLQQLPPLLHRQAEDHGHRWSRGPLPEAVRPEGRQVASTMRRSARDRKSTRLNSSHVSISYAVFCL